MATRRVTPKGLLKHMRKEWPCLIYAGIERVEQIEKWARLYRAADADLDTIREEIAVEVCELSQVKTRTGGLMGAGDGTPAPCRTRGFPRRRLTIGPLSSIVVTCKMC